MRLSTAFKSLLAAAMVLVAVPATEGPADATKPAVTRGAVGNMAPDFSLPTLDGERKVSMKDFKGKVVVINFWASWCPPCRRELPALMQLHEDYMEQDVEVVGLATDYTADPALQLWGKMGGNYTSLLADGNIQRAYGGPTGLPAIPMTFVVDREGKVVEMIRGERSYEYFERAITPYL